MRKEGREGDREGKKEGRREGGREESSQLVYPTTRIPQVPHRGAPKFSIMGSTYVGYSWSYTELSHGEAEC